MCGEQLDITSFAFTVGKDTMRTKCFARKWQVSRSATQTIANGS